MKRRTLLMLTVILVAFEFIGVVTAQEPQPQYVSAEELEEMEEGVVAAAPEKRTYKAEVVKVEKYTCEGAEENESEDECQDVTIFINALDEEVSVSQDLRADILAREWELEPGDQVVLTEFDFGETSEYQITDLHRSGPIWIFVLIYVVLVLIVGRWQGFGSLVGLLLSIFVLLEVTIPMTLKGWDPILVSLFGGFLVLIPSIYLSHGFNRKTTIALIGTTLGLVVTGILAVIAMDLVHLTGFGAEETLYLSSGETSDFNMGSILLASIIIGGIGLIDDVTVGQVAVIQELHQENPNMPSHKLYSKSMNVGKDHIASMVNTLFLAYAASSLPLLMLLVNTGASLGDIVNIETFAEEIVRTLVASSGLVLTLPITTALGAWVISGRKS